MSESIKYWITEKGNTYSIVGESGRFLLLGVEYPHEGCSIDDCRLFENQCTMEDYIDKHPISYEDYVAIWINISKRQK